MAGETSTKAAFVEAGAAPVETLAERATICHKRRLDDGRTTREGGRMLKTYMIRAVLAATFALAACGEPEVVTVNRYDPMADELRNAAPVEPPAARYCPEGALAGCRCPRQKYRH